MLLIGNQSNNGMGDYGSGIKVYRLELPEIFGFAGRYFLMLSIAKTNLLWEKVLLGHLLSSTLFDNNIVNVLPR